jgi:hypothetical protein
VVQFGDATASLPRLTALAELGPRAVVARANAQAWANADGETLLKAADEWTRLGDVVAAGDAAAQAADVHRRQGRQGSALSAAALAEKLAGRSGARIPALAIAVRPLPLTARERESVAPAARGLSNKDIAERLKCRCGPSRGTSTAPASSSASPSAPRWLRSSPCP